LIPKDERKSRRAAVLSACAATCIEGCNDRISCAVESGAILPLKDRGGGWKSYSCAKCTKEFPVRKDLIETCRSSSCILKHQLEMFIFKAGGDYESGLGMAEVWFGIAEKPVKLFIRLKPRVGPIENYSESTLNEAGKAFLEEFWRIDIAGLRKVSSGYGFSELAKVLIISRGLSPEILKVVSPIVELGILQSKHASITSRMGDHWESARLLQSHQLFRGLESGSGISLPLWSQYSFPTSFDVRFYKQDSNSPKSCRSFSNGLSGHVFACDESDLSNPLVWLVEGSWDFLTALEISDKIGWTGSVIGMPGSGQKLNGSMLKANRIIVMLHDNSSIGKTRENFSSFKGELVWSLLDEKNDLNDQYKWDPVKTTKDVADILGIDLGGKQTHQDRRRISR